MERLFKIHCSQIGKIMGNGKGGNLPVTCQTFLREWYANDREEIRSKYLEKGREVEHENIQFMADVLGYGIAEKNTIQTSDEYFIGESDVLVHDAVIDVKSPWNNKTLLDNIDGINPDYEYQLRGYMRLYNKKNAILFYGLLNTPETDFTAEVDFSHIPVNKRWLAYKIERDISIENQIIERVIKCREWLENYNELVNSKLGRVITV